MSRSSPWLSRRRVAPVESLVGAPVDRCEEAVGDLCERCRGREHEVGGPAQHRLDRGKIREHLGELGAGVPVRVTRPRTQPVDEHGARDGEQDAVVEGELGLLLGASGEEQEPAAMSPEQLRDPVGPPAPTPVLARLAEAVVIGVIGEMTAAPQLPDQGGLAGA